MGKQKKKKSKQTAKLVAWGPGGRGAGGAMFKLLFYFVIFSA